MTRALHFLAVVGHVNRLVGTEGAGHAHIGLIAENVFGLLKFALDGWRHQIACAGAKPGDGQPAALSPDQQHVGGSIGDRKGKAVFSTSSTGVSTERRTRSRASSASDT